LTRPASSGVDSLRSTSFSLAHIIWYCRPRTNSGLHYHAVRMAG
jgi:hypothetical protein